MATSVRCSPGGSGAWRAHCRARPGARARGAAGRRLPKVLSHGDIGALFAEVERRLAAQLPGARRLAALMELLYGSGLRATELVSLPRHALAGQQPFRILAGKG